jgi:hypothetical protein
MDAFEGRNFIECFHTRNKLPESTYLHFFKGLLPHIEGFSQHENLKFQRGVLVLITNVCDKS